METQRRNASVDALDITNPDMYVQTGYPHDAWKALRAEAPVYLYDRPTVQPFWALTKHEDIGWVSRNPEIFSSEFGVNLQMRMDEETIRKLREVVEQRRQSGADAAEPSVGSGGRMILFMDPPDHGAYRSLVNKHFTPRALNPLAPHIRELAVGVANGVATKLVDDVVGRGEIDFVTEVSKKLPLALIAEMLGVPEKDWDHMFDLSNKLIGAGDPEYAGDSETVSGAVGVYTYFSEQLAERRANPGQRDLISLLATSEIEGQKLPDADIMSYCLLLIVAGNETTRNATTGGMLALIEHPEQMERLRADPSLVPTAVEEILRWTSPIIHFARMVMEDTEIRGQTIKQGEHVVMWYPSANRDEEVFDDPYTFDVGRSPNDHLAFGGFGEHFCLGSNLARLELQVIFEEFARRLSDVELAGPVQRLRSNFVGGIKHMPVRLKLS